MTENADKPKRSSIFRRFSLLSKSSNTVVWEVRNESDLGLESTKPSKNKSGTPTRRRVRTLEGLPNSTTSPKSKEQDKNNNNSLPQSRHSSITFGAGQLSLPKPESESSIATRSNGSMYSAMSADQRRFGSAYSATSSTDRPRPRTLDGSIPPISPLTKSLPSITSSDRSSNKRASHIQLIPKSMLGKQAQQLSAEDQRRIERELLVLEARDRSRRSRSSSNNDSQQDRPASRDEGQRHRSDTNSSSASAKIRIQYVPRSSISLEEKEPSPPSPPIVPFKEVKTRINRALTAVTEETRIHSEYHSDIEEEDEEDQKSDS
jgi:hypothetical protein